MLAEHPDSLEQETTLFWTNYRRKLLHWAADQIKPDVKDTSWQSFWMTSIEGKKAEDVAEDLGLTVGSVYAAKFRIVKRIRAIIARHDDLELKAGDTKALAGDSNEAWLSSYLPHADNQSE